MGRWLVLALLVGCAGKDDTATSSQVGPTVGLTGTGTGATSGSGTGASGTGTGAASGTGTGTSTGTGTGSSGSGSATGTATGTAGTATGGTGTGTGTATSTTGTVGTGTGVGTGGTTVGTGTGTTGYGSSVAGTGTGTGGTSVGTGTGTGGSGTTGYGTSVAGTGTGGTTVGTGSGTTGYGTSGTSTGSTSGTGGTTGTTGTGTGGTSAATGTGTGTGGPGPQRVVGYFTSWSVYGRDFHVQDIDADKLTHVQYAFANVTGGACVLGDPWADTELYYPGDSWAPGSLRGSFHQLQILRAAHPHLKNVLSVGGWTWSGEFSDIAADPASRQAFAASCVQMLVDYDFDGIDIDWEFPVEGGLAGNSYRPDDGANYTLLLQELRSQLDAAELASGRDYSLSIAAPAPPTLAAHYEIGAIAGILDWINLMTYDMRGSWSYETGHQAPLYHNPADPYAPAATLNVDAAVQTWLAGGARADQLVVGVPFYGRGFSAVPNVNDGLFQAFSGVPAGTWEPGMFDYSDIAANWSTGSRWDATAHASFVYDPAQQVFITYDDPQAIAEKAAYVSANQLGGIMIWELSADTDADDLLNAISF